MRNLSLRRAVGVCASLALAAVLAPSTTRAVERDICVKILPPAKSVVKPERSMTGPAPKSSEVWAVDVTIGDCVPQVIVTGGGTATPAPWPALKFRAGLDVSSEGRALCSTTADISAISPPPKVFRFQVVYPAQEPTGSLQPGPRTTTSVPYTIRAIAQVTDKSSANNQATATHRLPAGGATSCNLILIR